MVRGDVICRNTRARKETPGCGVNQEWRRCERRRRRTQAGACVTVRHPPKRARGIGRARGVGRVCAPEQNGARPQSKGKHVQACMQRSSRGQGRAGARARYRERVMQADARVRWCTCAVVLGADKQPGVGTELGVEV